MHSVPAVEGQPVNNLIFGLAPGLEVHAMQAFNLQRAEKRFNLLFLEPLKSVSG